MPADPKYWIVTIRAGGEACGVGFLVGNRHVVTCAHVVNRALRRDLRDRARPERDDIVQLEFSLLGEHPHPLRHARVVQWSPPPREGSDPAWLSDIAGLEFVAGDDPPGNAEIAQLSIPDDHIAVDVFGYPKRRRERGTWSKAELIRQVRGELYQVNSKPGEIPVQPGYSGSPAVDGSDRVVGMVVLAHPDGEERDSYAIPPQWLHEAWPEVVEQPADGRVTGATSSQPDQSSPEEPPPPPPPPPPPVEKLQAPAAKTRQIEPGPTVIGRVNQRRKRAVRGFRDMPTPAKVVTILGICALIAALIIIMPEDDPKECTPLEVSVSTEKDELIGKLADDYNDASRTFDDGECAKVSVHGLTSGTAMQALVDGWKTHPISEDPLAPETKPQVWLPTSSMWLGLLREQKRGDLLAKETPRSITTSVLGVALPRRMAQAIRERYSGGITWEQIFRLATDPAGWGAAGHSEWGQFALGRDNPHYSTSGLAATVATYFAATQKRGDITEADLDNSNVVKAVHGIESSVAHYGDEATLFMQELYNEDRKYPNPSTHVPFVSAIVMQEQLAYLYNEGMPTGDIKNRLSEPHEFMEMIYPNNGTLKMDHPFVVLANASEKERRAAADFQAFLEDDERQQEFIERGFRARGDPERPTDTLVDKVGAPAGQQLSLTAPPAPNLIAKMRNDWAVTRKKARVRLVLDLSGSMKQRIDPNNPESPRKIDLLKPAAKRGVSLLGDGDEAGIWTFASDPEHRENVPSSSVETNRKRFNDVIDGLSARGTYTALYRAMKAAHQDMGKDFDHDRINAIILLTDGKNIPPNKKERDELIRQVTAENLDDSIRVFTISYGTTADKDLLKQIAAVSKASHYDASNPQNIDKVFVSVFSNFVG